MNHLSTLFNRIQSSIFFKFTVMLVVFTVVISMSLDFYMKGRMETVIESAIKEEASSILQSMDWAIAQLLEDQQQVPIQRLMDNTASNRMIQSLTLYSIHSEPMIMSGKSEISSESAKGFVEALINSQALMQYGKDEATQIYYYAIPIRGQTVDADLSKDWHGVLLLTINSSYVLEQINATLSINRWNLILIDGVILLSVWMTVHRYWMKPLVEFKALSEAIARRDYSVRFDTKDTHELGALASTFNNMTNDIRQYMAELSEAKEHAESEVTQKMQFFANMSHEIRTPLNLILGYISLLDEENLPREAQQKIAIISHSGQQLLAIVNDILDIAKFDLDDVILEQSPFSLPELMIELFGAFQPQFEEHNIRLKMTVAPECPHVFIGDSYRIQQILNNLISNALKFTPKGQVALTADYEAPNLILTVVDTGIGIPLEKQSIIFEAFKQTDMTTTRQYGGTGLGLAIVKRLCEAMGGSIELVSQVGEGSSFKALLNIEPVSGNLLGYDENLVVQWQLKDLEISDLVEQVVQSLPGRLVQFEAAIAAAEYDALEDYVHALKGVAGNFKMTELYQPLVAMDQELKDNAALSDVFWEQFKTFKFQYNKIPEKYFLAEKVKQLDLNKTEIQLRILLAEDVLENRLLIRHMLSKLPCQLDEAEDGEKALIRLQGETRYDVLLLDMHMPIVDGMTVLKTLRQNPEYNELQIVAMTASIQHHEVAQYLQNGVNYLLPKPVDKNQLRQYVLDLMAKI